MGSHLPDSTAPMTPHLFVEFAHVYADDIFGDEQETSLQVMKKYLDQESNPDSLVVAAILIDELHVKHNTLDVNEFIRCILRRGLAPDHVVFEGKLAPIAEQIIDRLPSDRISLETFRKAKKQVLTFELNSGQKIGLKTIYENYEEHSCAILSAAWTLCRGGVYEFPEDSIIRLTEAPPYGEKIVSVLHEKYRGVEEKVLELIKASNHDEILDKIEYVFFA